MEKEIKLKRYRLSLTTTERVKERLEALVEGGLYGGSVAEAGERLLCEALLAKEKAIRAKSGPTS